MRNQEYVYELKRIIHFSPPIDGIQSVYLKSFKIDILKFDEMIAQRNPDYDPEHCKYKDQENISMEDAIRLIYGDRAAELVNLLL